VNALLFPGFSLGEAARLYARRFEERSRKLALDIVQCRALLVLAENGGVTQQRLSELTGIAPPWLGRTLDRLEAMGLVQRRSRPADRRMWSLAITEDAKPIVQLLWYIVGESLTEALRGLPADEVAILANALERVIGNLSAPPVAPQKVRAHRSKRLRKSPAAARSAALERATPASTKSGVRTSQPTA
jgi:MarR family transcriptional regulator, transcriptional regulator for hemolysin